MASKQTEAMTADLVLLAELRDTIKAAEEEAGIISKRLLDDMQKAGLRRVAGQLANGQRVKGTLVEPTHMVLDEAKLKRRLGAVLWNKITSRVLDRKKLDALISTGVIAPGTIAQVTTEVPTTPYVKITK